MAVSSGSASSPFLVVLAPTCLLPDSQLLVMKQVFPAAAPPLPLSHQPAAPPSSSVVQAPLSREALPRAGPEQASKQRWSDFSVDFLLNKVEETDSPAEDLQTRILPLLLQQQQGGRGTGEGLPSARGVCLCSRCCGVATAPTEAHLSVK